jgi:hypothetical protein
MSVWGSRLCLRVGKRVCEAGLAQGRALAKEGKHELEWSGVKRESSSCPAVRWQAKTIIQIQILGTQEKQGLSFRQRSVWMGAAMGT